MHKLPHIEHIMCAPVPFPIPIPIQRFNSIDYYYRFTRSSALRDHTLRRETFTAISRSIQFVRTWNWRFIVSPANHVCVRLPLPICVESSEWILDCRLSPARMASPECTRFALSSDIRILCATWFVRFVGRGCCRIPTNATKMQIVWFIRSNYCWHPFNGHSNTAHAAVHSILLLSIYSWIRPTRRKHT